MKPFSNLPTQSIVTNRLLLLPLSYSQLLKYLQTNHSLESELGLAPVRRIVSPELMEAFQQAILPAVAVSTDQGLYYTLWTIIHKEQKAMVGDCCFKGPPDKSGEVEIGYGIHAEFQNKGFMTEAVGALCQWVLNQSEVKAVLAETEKTNLASQKILLKNGFSLYSKSAHMLWWRLVKAS